MTVPTNKSKHMFDSLCEMKVRSRKTTMQRQICNNGYVGKEISAYMSQDLERKLLNSSKT